MKWQSSIAALALIFAIALPRESARAADAAASADAIPDVAEDNSSYCGIYCVYAALNGFGHKPEFKSLLETRYIGKPEGSSIQELMAAVEDNGMHALPMMGLSRANLVTARTPIVLHVSLPSAPGYFGHWVLFLGMENGQAKILDVPHGPELTPIADVLARWDGVGLYISEQPMSSWRVKAESLMTAENLALFTGLLVMAAVLQRLMRRKKDKTALRSSWIMVPALLAAAGLLSLGWHLLSNDGYVRNQVAVRTVVQQHRPSFLPKLQIPEMEKALKDEKVIIVDARYPRDYQAGHLPGAINVPVFTTQNERRKLLGDVPRNARVIVYCQSDSCQFDEALGSALVAEGIENVALFPGGWMKWEQHRPEEAVKRETDQ